MYGVLKDIFSRKVLFENQCVCLNNYLWGRSDLEIEDTVRQFL